MKFAWEVVGKCFSLTVLTSGNSVEGWIINYQQCEKCPGSSSCHADCLLTEQKTDISSRHNSTLFSWHVHSVLHLTYSKAEMIYFNHGICMKNSCKMYINFRLKCQCVVPGAIMNLVTQKFNQPAKKSSKVYCFLLDFALSLLAKSYSSNVILEKFFIRIW